MNSTMGEIASLTRRARHGGKGGNVPRAYCVHTGDDTVDVAYRGTTVARFSHAPNFGNVVRLYTGGWRTTTTKNVINAALYDTPYAVYQKSFAWYVRDYRTPDADVDFSEGMTLRAPDFA